MNEKIHLALLAVLLAPSGLFAQEDLTPQSAPAPVTKTVLASSHECAAQSLPSGGSQVCAADGGGKLCHDLASCKRFCCCACKTDLSGNWWEGGAYDGRTSCPLSPTQGDGMISPDSTELKDLGAMLKSGDVPLLVGYKGKIATQKVAEGLKALNDALADRPDRAEKGFKVKVHNCYRRAVGNHLQPLANDGNTEAVCGMVYKLLRVENSPRSSDANKSEWRANAADVWGMAWPGQTPHSSGVACDIVLVDAKGKDCFDASAGPSSGHHCAIDAQEASEILDEAAASAGGWRLDYEAWHYEWGGRTGKGSCRCQGTDCKKFWPPTARVRCS